MTDHTTVLSNISQWLIELESGRHKQGKGYLLNDGAYCCLGVAADIVLKRPKNLPFDDCIVSLFDDFDGKLKAHEEIGLMNSYGKSRVEGTALWVLNDTARKSFPEIAAIIREDLATNKYGYFLDWVYPAWQEMNKDGN